VGDAERENGFSAVGIPAMRGLPVLRREQPLKPSNIGFSLTRMWRFLMGTLPPNETASTQICIHLRLDDICTVVEVWRTRELHAARWSTATAWSGSALRGGRFWPAGGRRQPRRSSAGIQAPHTDPRASAGKGKSRQYRSREYPSLWWGRL